ncbi:MAG: low temperature requirement protein A [Chloroflexota bacterium]
MAKSPLFAPPKYFKNVIFHRHTDRSVGWLELFYDLVYVATLIQIGNFLSKNTTLLGFGQFLVLTIVVWWAWTGETFYQNRYVVDDIKHRILVFIQIFAIATMGLSVSKAFGDLYIQFTLAYVLTRFVLVLMYVRAAKVDEEGRELSRGYIMGFVIGIIIWLCSLLVPAEIHWVAWLIGIAFELAIPLLPQNQRLARSLGFDRHHMSERFGIFTIIVLGEAFVKILDDAQGTVLGLPQFLFSIFGFLVLNSIWWLYFGETEEKVVNLTTRWKPIAWIYGHAPVAAGLIAFGVGAKKLYASTLEHPEDPVYGPYRLLYTTAVCMFLVALALIDYGLDHESKKNMQAIIHLVSAVIVAIIGLTVTGANAIVFVALIAVVMVAQVAYDVYLARQAA